jgi:hypothetical protein
LNDLNTQHKKFEKEHQITQRKKEDSKNKSQGMGAHTVIPVNWEAEFREFKAQGHLRQKVSEIHLNKKARSDR